MTARPEVSVVIPTRNREALLRRALASALAQEGVVVEAVVVDEASSDGTPAFLAGLRDDRVRWVRHELPRGVAAARNAGLEHAQAGWVGFLDDDDFWHPSKLAAQLAAGEGVDWVCAGDVVVDESGRMVGGHRPPTPGDLPLLLTHNLVPGGGSGTLVRTDVARGMHRFDESLAILADWDLWIRLSLEGAPGAADRPLVGYQRHARSMSHHNAGIERELRRVVAKHDVARRAAGVEVSRELWDRWVAQMAMRAGERRRAAALALAFAARFRDRRAMGQAACALVAPGFLPARWDRDALAALPAWWRADAERWISGGDGRAVGPTPHARIR